MSAPNDQELLSAYLDGEANAEERAFVERRLAESAEWRQLLDELKSLRGAFAALPRYRLSEDLSAAVLADAARLREAASRPEPEPGNGLAEERPSDQAAASRSAGSSAASADEQSSGPRSLPPEPDLLGRLRRRGWRAIVWPVLALAAALLVMVFDPSQRQIKVAQAPREPARLPLPVDLSIGAAPGDAKRKAPADTTEANKKLVTLEEERPRATIDRDRPLLELDSRGLDAAAGERTAGKLGGLVEKAAPAGQTAARAPAQSPVPPLSMESAASGGSTALKQESPGFGSASGEGSPLAKAAANGGQAPAAGELVVELQCRPGVAERGEFQKLLARNSIQVASTAPVQVDELRRAASAPAPNREPAAAPQTPASPAVNEVRFECSPQQLTSMLTELNDRVDQYAAINVQERVYAYAPGPQAFAQFNRSGDASFATGQGAGLGGAALGRPADQAQLAGSTNANSAGAAGGGGHRQQRRSEQAKAGLGDDKDVSPNIVAAPQAAPAAPQAAAPATRGIAPGAQPSIRSKQDQLPRSEAPELNAAPLPANQPASSGAAIQAPPAPIEAQTVAQGLNGPPPAMQRAGADTPPSDAATVLGGDRNANVEQKLRVVFYLSTTEPDVSQPPTGNAPPSSAPAKRADER